MTRHGILRPGRRRAAALVGGTMILAVAACTPIPDDFGQSPAPGASGASAPPAAPAGSPAVTVDGGVVSIIGLGTARTPDFELPAGSATMVVTACTSNQVIPFITLFAADGTNLGLIVEAEKKLQNLAGGGYYLSVSANPDCTWQVAITPSG